MFPKGLRGAISFVLLAGQRKNYSDSAKILNPKMILAATHLARKSCTKGSAPVALLGYTRKQRLFERFRSCLA